MFSPEKIIVYRSQSEKAMDDFFYGGGMFEEGFITPYIITDLVAFLIVLGLIIWLQSARPWRKKRF